MKRISDDFLCPLHPNGTHTWGECRTRTKGPSKEIKGDDKGKKKAQSFVAMCQDDKAETLSGEEGTTLPESDVLDTLLQLDEYLTSDALAFTSQDRECDDDDTQVFKAFCMAMEDSNATGMETSPLQRNEIISFSKESNSSLLPIGIMTVETMQGQSIKRPLKVLFDSGSMVTLLHPRVLSNEMVPHELARPLSIYSVGGTVVLRKGVTLQTLRFPELSPTRSYVNAVEAAHTRDYDVIVGIDVMVKAGLDVEGTCRFVGAMANTPVVD